MSMLIAIYHPLSCYYVTRVTSYFISLRTTCTAPSAFSIVLTIVPIEPIISPLALVPLVLTITTVREAFVEPQTMS